MNLPTDVKSVIRFADLTLLKKVDHKYLVNFARMNFEKNTLPESSLNQKCIDPEKFRFLRPGTLISMHCIQPLELKPTGHRISRQALFYGGISAAMRCHVKTEIQFLEPE